MKRKPTRKDLLIVIGRLQDHIGAARFAYEDDRNQDGLAQGRAACEAAMALCISSRSYDPPDLSGGPWDVIRCPECLQPVDLSESRKLAGYGRLCNECTDHFSNEIESRKS